MIEAVRDALSKLNDEEREIIDRLYFNDETIRSVAEVKKVDEIPTQTEVIKEEPVKEEPKKKKESKGAGLYIFLGLLVMAVVEAGYYFKIYKKNQEESEDSVRFRKKHQRKKWMIWQ